MATVNIKGVKLRKRVVMEELDSLNEVIIVLEEYVKEIYKTKRHDGVQKIIDGLTNKMVLANEEVAYLEKHIARDEAKEENPKTPKDTIISPEDRDVVLPTTH
jgi:hypothetical protein